MSKKDIWMLPDFRDSLRRTSGNRQDMKNMNIIFRKFCVDGTFTASVAAGDPGNDTKNHSNRIWIWAQLVLFNLRVCGHQQNGPSYHLIANGAKCSKITLETPRQHAKPNGQSFWRESLPTPACPINWSKTMGGIVGQMVRQMVGHMVGQMVQN